jgi:two-component system, OmpR family, sensor histidine kinase CiaH
MTDSPRHIGDGSLVRRVRWRLLAWSGGTTLVAMVVLGSLLYATVAWSLATTGEQQLRARAMDIAQGVESRGAIPFGAPPGDPFAGGQASDEQPLIVDRAEQPGLVIGGPTSGTIGFITSVEGGIVASNGVPRTLEPLLALRAAVTKALSSGRETIATTDVRGTPIRLLVLPVTLGSDQLIVQVIGDRTAEVNALGVLLIVLAIGGLAVLAASLVVGWVYAERALVPIRDALRRQREFAADASHELRTPLSIVRGSVEDLRRNADQPVASVGHALEDIEGEVDRLTALVDDLLLLARTDSGVVELASEPTDLAEVALDASEALVAEADRDGLRIEVDAHPVPLHADPSRLRQLVTILVDNAVRHAPSGSTIRVGVTAVDGFGRVRVEDEGPGFRPEDLPRAFDRFWRAPDAPPGGTGLGLSIAAWIAERHGGSITASNRPDGGARLEVLLPRG